MFFTILICKILRIIGKLIGKGSSLPGAIALKIDPNILSKIKLPKYVIAITGSNGKTSTVAMLNSVLINAGFNVASNLEGSNQIEGVTTLLLNNSTIFGKVKNDVVLLECDERYARLIFKHFTPTHFLITNLYRDQLTRNGHSFWVYNYIKQAICKGSKLILNADDPLVASLSNDAIFFGLDKYNNNYIQSVYDDNICPKCFARLHYEYRHYNHIGKFNCLNCGYKVDKYTYKISEVNLKEKYLIIDNKLRINLNLNSIYNAYNILAVYSMSKQLNIEDEVISQTLNKFILKNGRVIQFKIGQTYSTLLLSKHENSISYNQSIDVCLNDENNNKAVIVFVDAISRKYFTSETSWLWDIDFEKLNDQSVSKIYLVGKYCYDLALRFQYTNIEENKIEIFENVDECMEKISTTKYNHLYSLTCFSDYKKILYAKGVEIL